MFQKLAGATEEIYCKVCDVSFNSPKQAMQHYEGKNHQKKVRMSSQARNVTESQADHVTVWVKYTTFRRLLQFNNINL